MNTPVGINVQGLVGKLKRLKEESLERRKQEKKAKYEEKKRRERVRYYNKKIHKQLKNEQNLSVMTKSSECSASKIDSSSTTDDQKINLNFNNGEKNTLIKENILQDNDDSENLKKGAPKIKRKKKQSSDEKRRLEREKKRKQREKLRLNKKKHEEFCKKDRERKRQEYVPIAQRSWKQQLRKRKKWRDSKRLERKKNIEAKRVEEFLTNNSPPVSRSATPDVVQQNENTPPTSPIHPENAQTSKNNSARQQEPLEIIDAEKTRLLKKIKNLNEKVRQSNHALKLEKCKSERYKKRLQTAHASYRNNLQTPSPRSKVDIILKRGDPNVIKKQLLVGQVLQQQIKESSTKCTSNYDKKIISNVISGKISKKYRVTKYLKGSISYHSYNQSLSRSTLLPARTVRENAELKKKIQDFFISDVSSVQAPGKKDCITFNKNKMQKRYLTDSIANLYKLFKEKYGNVSFTTFYKNKPFWVVRQKLEARNTCLCVKHANFNYIFKKMLQTKQISALNTISDLGQSICCDVRSDLCLSRMCSLCDDKLNDILSKDANMNEKVSYNKWEAKFENRIDKHRKEIKVKITTKSLIISSMQEMRTVFKNSLKTFLPHHFRAHHQQEEIKFLQSKLSHGEAIINIDFSENYICKYDEEVQSVHFGGSRRQLALHTGVMYYKTQNLETECLSFSGVSDDLLHNALSVWAHLKPILTLMVERKIKVVHFVSDGPTSQYKNKTNFQLFCYFAAYYGIQFSTWNFYEPGHGKSVADGVGGTIKRLADQAVAFGKSITSAKTFIDNVQKNTKIFLYQVSTTDINEISDLSSKLGDNSVNVPNTMKIRQLIWFNDTPNSLILKYKSCLSCKTKCDHYLLHPAEFVFQISLLDKCLTNLNLENESDSDEDNLPLSALQAKNCDSSNEKQRTPFTEIEKGSWLLVRFLTEGSIETSKYLYYICQVSSIFDTKYEGNFLRKKATRDHQGFIYGFPDVPDLFVFELTNVLEKLPDPEPYGRGLLKFNINTDQI